MLQGQCSYIISLNIKLITPNCFMTFRKPVNISLAVPAVPISKNKKPKSKQKTCL